MSILIKGMEMPKSCFYCPFRVKANPDELLCLVTRETFEETFAGTIEMRNSGKCPLVEVPPHGRLVDGDALKEKWLAEENRMGADKVLHLPLKDYISDGCVYDLEQMPTIIEAEEET